MLHFHDCMQMREYNQDKYNFMKTNSLQAFMQGKSNFYKISVILFVV